MARASATETAEAAAVLRRLLAEVDAGGLSDGGAHGSRLMRRLEGAAAALEVAAGTAVRPPTAGRTAQ